MAEAEIKQSKRGGKRAGAGRKPKSKTDAQPQPSQAPVEAQAPEAEQPKPKIGRPSDYSLEIAAAICARLCVGESLRTICRDEDMPACSTVFKWLALHSAFAEQYARAREAQAEAIFEDILDIADDARNDWMERRGEEDSGWQVNGEHIQRSRLRIDARKWMAGKLAPKKYGERAALELTGKDGGPIETAEISERDVAQRTAFLLQRGLMSAGKPN